MNKGINKPSETELREDIKAIIEVTERLETIGIIRLKEIIIYLDKEIGERYGRINDLMIANYNTPNGEFDHLANNFYQYGYSLNGLKELKKFFNNHLISIQTKTTPEYENEIIKGVFKKSGFELFNYLDQYFVNLNDKITIKYSLIHWFLFSKVNLIYNNKKKFTEFVQQYCKNNLKGRKFARIETNTAFEDHQKENLPELTRLYNTFKETSTK